jgi:hypothetical protein
VLYISRLPGRRSLLTLAALVTATTVFAAASLPKGWEFSTTAPGGYSAEIDHTIFHTGKASGCLQSSGKVSDRNSAVLMQHVSALSYRRQRLRMTGYIRTSEVRGWAGMFMRVDPAHGPALEFDNMENRPIVGTTGWARYTIELNVPPESDRISFGALLAGSGRVWLDDVAFQAVGPAVPGSALLQKVRDTPTVPVNLGFED